MKLTIALALVVTVNLVFAAAPTQPSEPLVRCGGKGCLALVNAAPSAKLDLSAAAKGIDELLLIDTKVMSGSWTLLTATADFRATGANLAVFVVSDAALPISLVAMEARWAMVNAYGLSQAAIKKEVCRVVASLFSSQCSTYDGSALRTAFSREELETKVGEALTLDVLLPILNGLEKYGFEQYSMMTYREACESEIAPAPTNDVQRKIAAEFKLNNSKPAVK